jgi:hypothetical protein
MSIHDILGRLQAAERDFLDHDVLAPVVRGRSIGVRVAGIVCGLRVDDPDREGWMVLRPLSTVRAHIVRAAGLAEVRAYLRLFPAVRLIVLARDDSRWLALPAHMRVPRVRSDGPVALLLPEEGLAPFETVIARCDGRFFWYERRDTRRNPALAAHLRQALEDDVAPADLRRPGLSPEERAAYGWVRERLERARMTVQTARLADALAYAGAKLLAYTERDDVYTVAYDVDGQRCVSTIRKGDLSVGTAGICLSGRDGDFDLTSLTGVLREAEGRPIPRWHPDEVE